MKQIIVCGNYEVVQEYPPQGMYTVRCVTCERVMAVYTLRSEAVHECVNASALPCPTCGE